MSVWDSTETAMTLHGPVLICSAGLNLKNVQLHVAYGLCVLQYSIGLYTTDYEMLICEL